MDEHYEVEGVGQVRVGTKLELWQGGQARDWGEVTKLLPGWQVVVSWMGTADTLIHDVEDVVDICVNDWSGEVRALIVERAAAGPCGGGGGVTKRAKET